MKGIVCSCLVAFALSACGGASSPAAPGGGGVGGGGGPGVPAFPIDPPPAAPTPPTPPAAMLPGESFGILNATDRPIVAYGWWETRPGADGLDEPHWHWIVPLSGWVDPGETNLTPTANGPIVLPQPAVGPLDVAASFADGTARYARVHFAPPSAAVWRVE